MQKISATIIAFNEEKKILKALKSLHGIADEIVVVDSYSTDNTKKICIEAGVKFIEQIFLGYVEQKNFAIQQTTFDYVLSLDADEHLDTLLRNNILEIKKTGLFFDAYKMNRCTSIGKRYIKYGSWYPDKKIRLFNKHKAKWEGIDPHDSICINKEVICINLNGNILHDSFDNFESVISQANKFTSIQAKAMHKEGLKANIFQLIFNPFVAFIKCYFIKRGFLDGGIGFFIALTIAYQTFLKYFKLKYQN